MPKKEGTAAKQLRVYLNKLLTKVSIDSIGRYGIASDEIPNICFFVARNRVVSNRVLSRPVPHLDTNTALDHTTSPISGDRIAGDHIVQ